jgi:formate dehydrogenase
VGTEKAVVLMDQPVWDETLLNELTRVMTDASICGLGQAAMNPVKQVLKHFRDDLATAPAAAPPPVPVGPARY